MHLKEIEILNLWDEDPVKIKFDNNITFLTGVNGSGKSTILNIIFDSLSINKNMPATSKNRFWSSKAVFDSGLLSYACIFPLPDQEESITEIFDNEAHFHNQNTLHRLEKQFQSEKERLVIKSVRYNEELKGHSAKLCLMNEGIRVPISKFNNYIPNTFLFQEDRECLHNPDKIESILNFSSFRFYKNSIDERFAYVREAFAIHESRASKVLEDVLLNKNVLSMPRDEMNNFLEEEQLLTALKETKKKNAVLNKLDQYLSLSGKQICRDNENKITLCRLNDEKPISWSLLSRGEKTLIYLFLVCFIYKGSLFLFDEPEISLHVEWQKNLITDLSEISEKSQFIIATHSPTMVREGWLENCLKLTL